MSQSYTVIPATTNVGDSLALLLGNDAALLSCFAGTAYPTGTYVVPGIMCLRTDQGTQGQLYQMNNASAWVLIADLGMTYLPQQNADVRYQVCISSAGTAPTTGSTGLSSLKGIMWHNTTANTVSIRDQADSAWILLYTLDETGKTAMPAYLDKSGLWAGAATGTANALVLTTAPKWPSASFGAGSAVSFTVAAPNTGGTTAAINGGSSLTVTKNGTTALTGGELVVGPIYTARSDGTNLQLIAVSGGYLASASNLSDLANAGTARTNLGVPGLAGANTYSGPQRSSTTVLTYASTVTADFSLSNDYQLTLTGATATLANPTNLAVGQSGHIAVGQDATGGRLLAYGTYWNFGGAGAPTLSTTASKFDIISYWVRTTTDIRCSFVKGS